MSRTRTAAPDVRVHIGRVVIDRQSLPPSGVAGLRERLTDRIASRLDDEGDARVGTTLTDAVADAVRARVRPLVTGGRD